MGLRHPHRKQLGPVALHAPPQGFDHQVLHLLSGNLHVLEPFPRQDDLGPEIVDVVGVVG